MNRWFCSALALLCTTSIFATDATPPAPPLPALSLTEMLLKVREKNPEVLAARQAWKVKRAEVSGSSAWPDPTLSYVDEKFPGTDGQEKIKHYRVEQGIPFPGKLTTEARMKHHEAMLAATEYRATLLEAEKNLRMFYYQLYLTDQKIDLAYQSVEVLRNALQTAQSRMSSGKSSAGDVFMAQTELRKMENALYEQQQGRKLVAIELNTLLDQPTDTVLGNAGAPALMDIPGPLTDFQQVAKRNAPLYLAAMHELNHSRAMVTRSKLGWAPDFGVMYEKEKAASGVSGRQIGLSVSFPLWIKRPWSENKAAQEHLAEALASGRQMENMVLKMVHMEYTETQTHRELAKRYETGVLPAALSNLRVARQQYASGQGDFLRLLEALRTWLEAHNQYQEQLYHYGEHWTELGRWVGVPVERVKEALTQQEWKTEEDHEN